MIVEEGGKNKYISTEEAFKGLKDADKWIAEVVECSVAGIAWPVGNGGSQKYPITSAYGPRPPIPTKNGTSNGFHNGVDIAAP